MGDHVDDVDDTIVLPLEERATTAEVNAFAIISISSLINSMHPASALYRNIERIIYTGCWQCGGRWSYRSQFLQRLSVLFHHACNDNTACFDVITAVLKHNRRRLLRITLERIVHALSLNATSQQCTIVVANRVLLADVCNVLTIMQSCAWYCFQQCSGDEPFSICRGIMGSSSGHAFIGLCIRISNLLHTNRPNHTATMFTNHLIRCVVRCCHPHTCSFTIRIGVANYLSVLPELIIMLDSVLSTSDTGGGINRDTLLLLELLCAYDDTIFTFHLSLPPYRNVLRSIINALYSLMAHVCQGVRMITALELRAIEWLRRSFSKGSDLLCEVLLDEQLTHTFAYCMQTMCVHTHHILCVKHGDDEGWRDFIVLLYSLYAQLNDPQGIFIGILGRLDITRRYLYHLDELLSFISASRTMRISALAYDDDVNALKERLRGNPPHKSSKQRQPPSMDTYVCLGSTYDQCISALAADTIVTQRMRDLGERLSERANTRRSCVRVGSTERCSTGRGLHTTRILAEGTPVIAYYGELMSIDHFTQLPNRLQSNRQQCYSIKIQNHVVDMSKCGSLARHMNHSCIPNCDMVLTVIDDCIVCAVVTNQTVPALQELTVDYHSYYIGGATHECSCGSNLCRSFVQYLSTSYSHEPTPLTIAQQSQQLQQT